MQATVRGVTLTIESGPVSVRVTVRRAWWTPYGLWTALTLLVSTAVCVLLLVVVSGLCVGAWLGDSATDVDGRLWSLCPMLVVLVISFAHVRWTVPGALSVLCGDESVEVRPGAFTARRRNPLRRWEKTLQVPVEREFVVSAMRRGCVTLQCERQVGTTPLGAVGGLSIDGGDVEWICRIAPGLGASTANALIRQLGAAGEWPRLRVPIHAADPCTTSSQDAT